MKLGNKLPDDAMELGYNFSPTFFGTGQEMANNLFSELQNNGYALTIEDVEGATLNAMRTYASLAVMYVQQQSNEPIILSLDTMLESGEYEMIRPYLRAYCDLENARLFDASKSMGTDGFVTDESTARQTLSDELDKLKFNAYFEPPMMLTKANKKAF